MENPAGVSDNKQQEDSGRIGVWNEGWSLIVILFLIVMGVFGVQQELKNRQLLAEMNAYAACIEAEANC